MTDDDRLDDPDIHLAARVLREGGLVAFPTETVYGLGANALDADAVGRVFRIKNRPANNPLIVHVPGVNAAASLAAGWTDSASRLAHAFWPGPLTLVLPKNDRVPPIVTAGGATVALRCPDHPVALALLDRCALPLVGPSANASGAVSPTRAEHVTEWLGDRVPVLDGGPCRLGIESTVVHLDGSVATILRRGLITPDQLGALVEVDERTSPPAQPADDRPLASPGLLDRHYAPETPARLFGPGERDAAIGRAASGENTVVIAHEPCPVHARVIAMPRDAASYARVLYAALRAADAVGAAELLIETPSGTDQLWDAIRDRLRRAAAG